MDSDLKTLTISIKSVFFMDMVGTKQAEQAPKLSFPDLG